MKITDAYLLPLFLDRGIEVRQFEDSAGMLCWEVPDTPEVERLTHQFYYGKPDMELSDYIQALKKVRGLIADFRRQRYRSKNMSQLGWHPGGAAR